MRVEVDRSKCQGHGLCVYEAPEVFDLDDQGTLVVLISTPSEALRAGVEGASMSCPTEAISILE